jgi:hypothetical protein
MTNKTAKQRERMKDIVIKHSRDIIWNASLMLGSLKQRQPIMHEAELEAHLEILSSYLGDAWERLSLEDGEE